MMELVSTVTVGSGGLSSIEFTNIPQTGKDLFLLISARSAHAGGFDEVHLTLGNNKTNTNHSYRALQGYAGSVNSYSGSSVGFVHTGYIPASGFDANTFGNTGIYISNYTSTTDKSLSSDVAYSGTGEPIHTLTAGKRTSSTALTNLLITNYYATTFVQYSTFSLYIIS